MCAFIEGCHPRCHCYPLRQTAICLSLRSVPFPMQGIQHLVLRDSIFRNLSDFTLWLNLKTVDFRNSLVNCSQIYVLKQIDVKSLCTSTGFYILSTKVSSAVLKSQTTYSPRQKPSSTTSDSFEKQTTVIPFVESTTETQLKQ